jgi:hypothetical protein
MAAENIHGELLDALATHAAASLGPIATLIVEQADAGGGGFEVVRRRVAAQMDAAAAKAFMAATEPLAAKATAAARAAGTPSVPPSAPVQGSATLDRSDPALIQALAGELKARIGPGGQTLVEEAARKCRTTVQFYLRLAAAVGDPELKEQFSQRAAAEAAARSAPRA